jgi:hypothetical protein
MIDGVRRVCASRRIEMNQLGQGGHLVAHTQYPRQMTGVLKLALHMHTSNNGVVIYMCRKPRD